MGSAVVLEGRRAPRRSLRLGNAALALATAVLAGEVAVAFLLILHSNHEPHKTASLALALTAGVSFAVSGLIALKAQPENRTGLFLAGVGYLWFLGALSEGNSDVLYTAGTLVGSYAFIPFAALVLTFPSGELKRLDRRIVGFTFWFVLLAPLVYELVDSRPVPDCTGDCPRSAIVVYDSHTLARIVNGLSTAVAVGLIATAVLVLVVRWRAASAIARRTLAPVYAAGAAALVLLLLSNLMSPLSHSADDVLGPIFLIVFGAVPLAFLAGLLRSRLARGSVAELMLAIGNGTPLRDALSTALNDPSLELAYWLEDDKRFVDREGRRLELTSSGATLVQRDGRRVGALLHDPSLANEPQLVASVSAAVALTLDNERLQAELRSQIMYLRTILNATPSLVVSVDLDGRILALNRETLTASGYAADEEVVGRYFWEIFIDPDEREAMQQRFHAAAPAHSRADYENTFTNVRGELLTIAWRGAPVVDESGRTVRIIAGGIDITERKLRELELQLERDSTDTLVQTIPTLIVVVDDAGKILGHEGRAGVNRALRDTLGWTDDELAGRSVYDLIGPVEETIAEAATRTTGLERESLWRCADGSSVIVAWTATSIPDPSVEGRSLVLLSGTDITHRKQQEEEIRASRARIVAAADDERRKLERNLHDGAQQRLVALSLALRLAQRKLATDPEASAKLLDDASSELAQALEELRELARGIHPALLTDRGLKAALLALAERTPLPVELEVPEERLPAALEAAAYYVVSESIANVIKHARATSVEVRVARNGESVTIEVGDDGVGGAAAGGGSGLRGLADRLAALDGTVQVESPVGGGTRVVACAPLRDD